ncbi:carbohydrate ABC transporter permease [Agromyces kandeliae]|uniref:ABC transporter permease subunit n=1 Tax=Agromyces kandeliae TaxID=2666141 RepID=A0A6L5R5R9_9MICO|nr:carbohydrate ABC transporter permease [Agromyces kandeliae]MRX45235.1 ABC transporter permease subunit [Agromyces kandeliae]
MVISTESTSTRAVVTGVPRPPRTEQAGRRRRKWGAEQVLLYALLIFAALTALFPIFFLLTGSLMSLQELYRGASLLPTELLWGNYATAWVEGNLAVYLTNSLIYTLTSVLGILIVSSLAGYALARLEFWGKNVFMFVILAVLIIPAPAMFIAQYKLLIGFGLTNSPVGYVLVMITAGIPVATLIMRSFFVNQPKDLEEAAALDGASSFTIFARVILPLARPGLAAVAVIQGLGVWNEYLMALVLFRDDNLMPVQRGLTSFVNSETPQEQILLAATAISVVPVIILYLLAQKQIVQGLGAGALK